MTPEVLVLALHLLPARASYRYRYRTGTARANFRHALREHGVDRFSAFDDDCINDPKNPWRWANSLGHGAHQILREQCDCGRNARNMCTERVRGWAQFGHGEMFGILVKVLLSRRLLEDAGPADFGVELDLPLSTTVPCHELSFQREDRLRDFNG